MSHWQPSAAWSILQQRAAIISDIRAFFAERHILEVETPLLCQASVTDVYIDSLAFIDKTKSEIRYLQTSPEYAMKRLLAAGSGPIYQLCKAFRQEENGRQHNTEFSILEWYRLRFDHHALINEVDALLQRILQQGPADRVSYSELFLRYLQLNPHTATLPELKQCAQAQNIHVTNMSQDDNRDNWLMLLCSHCIEPVIGMDRPIFIYDFPAGQAALAKIRAGDPPVASRFEVYYRGMELANGFHELQDAQEQEVRFRKDLALRAQLGKTPVTLDNRFLAALQHGLPDCAGVALGIDRLIMLATGSETIADVLSFDFSRA